MGKLKCECTNVPNVFIFSDDFSNVEKMLMWNFIKLTQDTEDNKVAISLDKISKSINYKRKNTICESLNHLEELGIITIERHSPTKKQTVRSNVYLINYDKINEINSKFVDIFQK